MISVDYREFTHCSNLLSYFQPYGIPVERAEAPGLPGDFQFCGNGEFGLASFCIERKKVSELADAMTSRRLAGMQLQHLCEQSDYGYLLVEGIWSVGRNGEVVVPLKGKGWQALYSSNKAVNYRQLTAFISSICHQFRAASGDPPMFIRTSNIEESVAWIVAEYQLYQKPWDRHDTHKTVYAPPPSRPRRCGTIYRPPSYLELFVGQLPHIDAKAQAVAAHFRTPDRWANATVKDWLEIDGVGPKTAEKAVRIMKEELALVKGRG